MVRAWARARRPVGRVWRPAPRAAGKVKHTSPAASSTRVLNPPFLLLPVFCIVASTSNICQALLHVGSWRVGEQKPRRGFRGMSWRRRWERRCGSRCSRRCRGKPCRRCGCRGPLAPAAPSARPSGRGLHSLTLELNLSNSKTHS
jgi:hypothetical protein